MHAVDTSMNAVKRTKDVVDILEHAMQGVHTSEDHRRLLRSRDDQSGIIGMSSRTEVRALDAPEVEREVIVSMPDRRARTR